MVYIHKLKERKWQLPKNAELIKAMQQYEEGTDFVKTWLLKNFRIGLDGENEISMSYIFQKFESDYIDEFGKSPMYKKNTITKRIGEIFRDKGERKDIKLKDGSQKKDRFFRIAEKVIF